MSSIFWILGGFLANMIIGASVWAAIDDDQQSLLRWYHECPPQIAWLAQPLALTAWPIALWFWRKNKRNNVDINGYATLVQQSMEAGD